MAARLPVTPCRIAWFVARPLAIALGQKLARIAFDRAVVAFAERRARRATWEGATHPAPGGPDAPEQHQDPAQRPEPPAERPDHRGHGRRRG
ncbi:hypothetical protein [Streptomyces bohaiensis]|uniref:hypothetical protein n=1 Tax=Streptomyces bohaiensis TaxID=1431344 RepID=UPI003B76475C